MGAHGGERGGVRLLGAHLAGHVLGDDVVDGGVEAVLQQRGDRPVRVVGEAQLLGVGEPGQHPLPRCGGVEQEQPAHPASVGGPRRTPVGQHAQRDGGALVDQGGVALDGQPAGAPLEGLGHGADRPRRQAGALQRGPGARHPGPHRAAGAVAQGVEVLAAGHDPPAGAVDAEGDPQVVGHPRQVPLPRRDADAGALVEHPGQLLDERAARRVGLGERRHGVVGGRHEVAAGRLGQRLEQGDREVVAQTRAPASRSRRRSPG